MEGIGELSCLADYNSVGGTQPNPAAGKAWTGVEQFGVSWDALKTSRVLYKWHLINCPLLGQEGFDTIGVMHFPPPPPTMGNQGEPQDELILKIQQS